MIKAKPAHVVNMATVGQMPQGLKMPPDGQRVSVR
jgi:hypothetical protein